MRQLQGQKDSGDNGKIQLDQNNGRNRKDLEESEDWEGSAKLQRVDGLELAGQKESMDSIESEQLISRDDSTR